MSPRIFPLLCALAGLLGLLAVHAWRSGDPLSSLDPSPPMERHSLPPALMLRDHRVGHDWVEWSSPADPEPPPSTARVLMAGGDPAAMAECRQAGCRTCEWTRLFGGEW